MSNPKPPVDLGLVIAIHAFAQQGMFGDNQPHTAALRVQLESLGGKSYFLSLTVETSTEFDFSDLKLAASARLPVRTSTACGANRFKH
jgi:hypothetical protein